MVVSLTLKKKYLNSVSVFELYELNEIYFSIGLESFVFPLLLQILSVRSSIRRYVGYKFKYRSVSREVGRGASCAP